MSLKKMSKDELELMSNKDITYLLLEESSKPINTLNLFKKIALPCLALLCLNISALKELK